MEGKPILNEENKLTEIPLTDFHQNETSSENQTTPSYINNPNKNNF